jgi:hypothetical protein
MTMSTKPRSKEELMPILEASAKRVMHEVMRAPIAERELVLINAAAALGGLVGMLHPGHGHERLLKDSVEAMTLGCRHLALHPMPNRAQQLRQLEDGQ